MYDNIDLLIVNETTLISPLSAIPALRDLRPVPTPSVLLVTSKIRDIQNQRKYFVDAEVLDEHGGVLAKGRGLVYS